MPVDPKKLPKLPRKPGGGTEMFYRDEHGKKQDEKLHAEMLGDDVMPWDIPAEYFTWPKAKQDAFMARRDRLMSGEEQ